MAIINQVAEAARAQVIANICIPALLLKADNEMIPFLIVPATLAPASTAPRNSNIPARIHACRIVSDREDTLVANELVVSEES